MILKDFNQITSTCWNEKYHLLTLDMTKDKNTSQYRLALNSIFITESSPF